MLSHAIQKECTFYHENLIEKIILQFTYQTMVTALVMFHVEDNAVVGFKGTSRISQFFEDSGMFY